MFTRRDFLKWSSRSAGALGLSQVGLFQLGQALEAESSPPLIWLHGSSCSGCSIAALNAVAPTTFGDLLLNRVSVKYDGLLMAGGGDLAIRTMDSAAQANDGRFILIVEGGIPTAERGRYCIIGERDGVPITLLDAVNQLGPRASRVLAVGTCASYKGVAGAGDNWTGVAALSDVLAGKLAKPVINVPGCPVPAHRPLHVSPQAPPQGHGLRSVRLPPQSGLPGQDHHRHVPEAQVEQREELVHGGGPPLHRLRDAGVPGVPFDRDRQLHLSGRGSRP